MYGMRLGYEVARAEARPENIKLQEKAEKERSRAEMLDILTNFGEYVFKDESPVAKSELDKNLEAVKRSNGARYYEICSRLIEAKHNGNGRWVRVDSNTYRDTRYNVTYKPYRVLDIVGVKNRELEEFATELAKTTILDVE